MDFIVWTVFIRFEKNNLELHKYVSKYVIQSIL